MGGDRVTRVITAVVSYYGLRYETLRVNSLHPYSYYYYQVRTITFLPIPIGLYPGTVTQWRKERSDDTPEPSQSNPRTFPRAQEPS
jgi:hypothetical protein